MQLPLLCRVSSCCTSLSFSRYVGKSLFCGQSPTIIVSRIIISHLTGLRKKRQTSVLLFSILNRKPVRFHHRFCWNQRILYFWLFFLKSASKPIKKKGKVNLSLMFYFNIMLTSDIHLTFLNVHLFKKSVLGHCQEFADAVMIRIVFISSPSEKLAKCTCKQLICKTGNKEHTYENTLNLTHQKRNVNQIKSIMGFLFYLTFVEIKNFNSLKKKNFNTSHW